jgi:hypothetical protein
MSMIFRIDQLNGTAANATATAGNNTPADYVSTVFNYLDANNDGGLNSTEYDNYKSLYHGT